MTTFELTKEITRLVYADPRLMTDVNRWYLRLKQNMLNRKVVYRLQACPGWSNFNITVLLEFANNRDIPFVHLMIRLAKDRVKLNVISMHRWWRRMIATGQEHIITYLNYPKLMSSYHKDCMTYDDILFACTESKTVFDTLYTTLHSNKVIDFELREALGGISMATDIHKAWHDWAKLHHPDKGGDAETFIRTKTIYEEWEATHAD